MGGDGGDFDVASFTRHRSVGIRKLIANLRSPFYLHRHTGLDLVSQERSPPTVIPGLTRYLVNAALPPSYRA